MKRKNFSQLPSNKTMQDILEVEEGRDVPASKLNVHYPLFTSFLDWLAYLNVDTSFLSEADWQIMMDKARSVQEIVVEKTLQLVTSDDKKLLKLLSDIESFLGETDSLEKTDVILVLGSADLGRVDKAVKLFGEGYGQLLLMSGRSRMDSEESETEASVFAKRAFKLGVDRKSVLLENTSVTVASNIRHSLNLLDRKNINYTSIMTITAWFAQRRAWCHLMKYIKDVKVIRVNSDMESSWRLAPGNWYKNEFGINVIFGEFLKMKMAESINSI